MSYDNPRIKDLNMSTMQVIVTLAEGNPDAVTCMAEILKQAGEIDPDDFLRPMGPLLRLDTLDCYGSRIWQFYKDVCDHDINMMLGLMRANQLGFLSEGDLNRAIDGRIGRDNEKETLDIQGLLRKVKERLPAFQMGNALKQDEVAT